MKRADERTHDDQLALIAFELAGIQERADLVERILRAGHPLNETVPGLAIVVSDISHAAQRAESLADDIRRAVSRAGELASQLERQQRATSKTDQLNAMKHDGAVGRRARKG
jgi:methyl-accepting chemotaxis protein